MSDFNFTVDTDEMAEQISSVSKRVDVTIGAVVTMQNAVVETEQKCSDNVCENVNKGFHTLIRSQITQKIAQLKSTIESKLLELGQQSIALQGIKSRMERDYNMISNRYNKLFNSINASLQNQIFNLDKQLVNIVNKDLRINSNRISLFLGSVSTNQLESVLDDQLISISKTKKDGSNAIESIGHFVKGTNEEKQASNEIMRSKEIKGIVQHFIPIAIIEYQNELGYPSLRYFVPYSKIEEIDKAINMKVGEILSDAIDNKEWEQVNEEYLKAINDEFNTFLSKDSSSDRIKKTTLSLYNNNVFKQFK
jgi:hypothetical protein